MNEGNFSSKNPSGAKKPWEIEAGDDEITRKLKKALKKEQRRLEKAELVGKINETKKKDYKYFSTYDGKSKPVEEYIPSEEVKEEIKKREEERHRKIYDNLLRSQKEALDKKIKEEWTKRVPVKNKIPAAVTTPTPTPSATATGGAILKIHKHSMATTKGPALKSGPKIKTSPEGKEEVLKKISELLKKGVDRVVIHGHSLSKGGERSVKIQPDVDTRGALYLLNSYLITEEATKVSGKWTSVEKSKYRKGSETEIVHKGQTTQRGGGKGKIIVHVDTGSRGPSIETQPDGSIHIFLDHHQKERDTTPTSATKIAFDTLVENKLIEDELPIRRMKDWITSYDNLSYTDHPKLKSRDTRKNLQYLKEKWPKSIYALIDTVPFEKVLEWAREGRDPMDPEFTDKEKKEKFKLEEDTRENTSLKKLIDEKKIAYGAKPDTHASKTEVAFSNEELNKLIYTRVDDGKSGFKFEPTTKTLRQLIEEKKASFTPKKSGAPFKLEFTDKEKADIRLEITEGKNTRYLSLEHVIHDKQFEPNFTAEELAKVTFKRKNGSVVTLEELIQSKKFEHEKSAPGTPFQLSFTDEELSKATWNNRNVRKFRDVSLGELIKENEAEIANDIDSAVPFAEAMRKKNGIKNWTEELGRILYNTKDTQTDINGNKRNNHINHGFLVTKAKNYDTFINYNEQDKKFFINSTTKDLTPIFERIQKIVPGAVMVRGVMILPAPELKDREAMTREQFLDILGLQGEVNEEGEDEEDSDDIENEEDEEDLDGDEDSRLKFGDPEERLAVSPDGKLEKRDPLDVAIEDAQKKIEAAQKKVEETRGKYITEYKKCKGEMKRHLLVERAKMAIGNIFLGVKNLFTWKDKEDKKIFKEEEYFTSEAFKKAKKEYTEARIGLGNAMYDKKKLELQKAGLSEEQIEKALIEYKAGEILTKTIIEERQKVIDAQVPLKPALWKRVVDRYMSIKPRWKRVALSTLFFLPFAAGGAASVSTLAGIATFRFARSMAVGTIAGHGNKLLDLSMVRKDEEFRRSQEASLEKLSKRFSQGEIGVEEYEKEYVKLDAEKKRRMHHRMAAKAAIGIALAGGVAAILQGQAPEVGHATPTPPTNETTPGIPPHVPVHHGGGNGSHINHAPKPPVHHTEAIHSRPHMRLDANDAPPKPGTPDDADLYTPIKNHNGPVFQPGIPHHYINPDDDPLHFHTKHEVFEAFKRRGVIIERPDSSLFSKLDPKDWKQATDHMFEVKGVQFESYPAYEKEKLLQELFGHTTQHTENHVLSVSVDYFRETETWPILNKIPAHYFMHSDGYFDNPSRVSSDDLSVLMKNGLLDKHHEFIHRSELQDLAHDYGKLHPNPEPIGNETMEHYIGRLTRDLHQADDGTFFLLKRDNEFYDQPVSVDRPVVDIYPNRPYVQRVDYVPGGRYGYDWREGMNNRWTHIIRNGFRRRRW
jgi:hypothetical protein